MEREQIAELLEKRRFKELKEDRFPIPMKVGNWEGGLLLSDYNSTSHRCSPDSSRIGVGEVSTCASHR